MGSRGAGPDPAPVRLVVFDCDGVLVDSEHLAVRVESQLLAELGWPLGEDEVLERFVGRSDAHMVAEVEAALGRPVPDFVEEYRRRLHAAFDAELAAVDGVVDALDRIDAAGIASCVASSGTHEKMDRTLGLTGLRDRFGDRVFSATQVAHGKPAPDLFLLAAASLGVAPRHCVVVEDSRPGVAAARAAQMRVVGYVGGITPRAWLEGDATAVISDLGQLPGLLGIGGAPPLAGGPTITP